MSLVSLLIYCTIDIRPISVLGYLNQKLSSLDTLLLHSIADNVSACSLTFAHVPCASLLFCISLIASRHVPIAHRHRDDTKASYTPTQSHPRSLFMALPMLSRCLTGGSLVLTGSASSWTTASSRGFTTSLKIRGTTKWHYAVRIGSQPGIYATWEEARINVHGMFATDICTRLFQRAHIPCGRHCWR